MPQGLSKPELVQQLTFQRLRNQFQWNGDLDKKMNAGVIQDHYRMYSFFMNLDTDLKGYSYTFPFDISFAEQCLVLNAPSLSDVVSRRTTLVIFNATLEDNLASARTTDLLSDSVNVPKSETPNPKIFLVMAVACVFSLWLGFRWGSRSHLWRDF